MDGAKRGGGDMPGSKRYLLMWGEMDDSGGLALRGASPRWRLGKMYGCVYYWDRISCLRGTRARCHKSHRKFDLHLVVYEESALQSSSCRLDILLAFLGTRAF